MMYNGNYWEVRITHLPTGISAIRTSQHFRYQREARESAMRYIKSRLYMLGHPPIKACDLHIEAVE